MTARDALREFVNIASGNAANALAQLLDRREGDDFRSAFGVTPPEDVLRASGARAA